MSRSGQALRVLVLLLVVYALPASLLSSSSSASVTPSATVAVPGSQPPVRLGRTQHDCAEHGPVRPGAQPGTQHRASPPPVSPFTGLPTDLDAPVLCVKIDNAAGGPPAKRT